MRAILVLSLLSLLATPFASANHAGGAVFGCDLDDDLYNHCHLGPVHWVTGPACAGVAVKAHAECVSLRELLA